MTKLLIYHHGGTGYIHIKNRRSDDVQDSLQQAKEGVR